MSVTLAAGAPLTARELQIVELVARGLKDREIADQLVVSVRTVHCHLTHIYLKTGIRSRHLLALEYLDAGPGREDQMTVSKTDPPVRLTVDLTPDLHRMLSRWAFKTAEDLEVAKLSLADVVRAMICSTVEQPDVADAVQAMIVQRAAGREARS